MFASVILAGPGGHLELVNLSPYNWTLTYQHSYHMDWKPTKLIPAGGRHEQYVEYKHDFGKNGDCGAEATYRLQGTEYEFTVQARQNNGKKILIEYNDALATKTLVREKVIDLGFDHDGSVLFVLSGDGVEPYVTSQAPRNWMQATLPTIGNKQFREISMPMSHNAGMYKVSYKYLGIAHNTKCQTQDIYSQLAFGSRWFDLRPAHAHGKWLTNHASQSSGGEYIGSTGANFVDIVNDINRFTEETPGELIVLEIGHELDGHSHKLKDGLSDDRWEEFYKLLEGIDHLWRPKDKHLPEDLTTVPISHFIKRGGKSAVIIRVPNHAPLPDSGHPAFVYEHRLPWTGDWVQTSNPAVLDSKLTCKLNEVRSCSTSPLFRFAYTISPRVKDMMDIANPLHSIIGESMWAEHELYQTIWDKLSPNTYPNLIEMDNIHNTQITAISMVINQRYASANKKRDVEGEPTLTKWRPRAHAIAVAAAAVGELRADDLKEIELDEANSTSISSENLDSGPALDELDDANSTSIPAEDLDAVPALDEPDGANSTSISELPTTLQTQYIDKLHTTTVTVTLIDDTTSTHALEPRARGPKRKNDHVFRTAEGHHGTHNHEWNTGHKTWCTGDRRALRQFTEIATIVYEFVGSTTTSATTTTLSAEEKHPRPYYPSWTPVSYIVWDETTTWTSTMPMSSPLPTPSPIVQTIRFEDYNRFEASTADDEEKFLCTLINGLPFGIVL